MPLHALPIETASLRIRHLVVEEAERMMELNGEESTRRWLPSHVYADTTEAIARMRFLVGSYTTPGDPRLGPYVLAVEHLASGVLTTAMFAFMMSCVDRRIEEGGRLCGEGAERDQVIQRVGFHDELADVDAPVLTGDVRNHDVQTGSVGEHRIYERRTEVNPTTGRLQHPLHQVADLVLRQRQRRVGAELCPLLG